MKKLAIIGRGTVGCMSALHFKTYSPDLNIEWHYDPKVAPQSVGEGTTLVMPRILGQTLSFSAKYYPLVDATVKTGIFKSGWGEGKDDYLHDFPSPSVAMHFNANKLQDYIFNRVKNHVKTVEHNVSCEDIDADFILDCSGKPDNFDLHHQSPYIPVNSVHVTQCFWDAPQFTHTLTIARPYGWVFGIPLGKRCSIGYMYNSSINTLEEVKEDVKAIFSDYNLTPSEVTNSFSFNNYYRKNNFSERLVYNGNSSYFMEPLEATSFGTANHINVDAFNVFNKLMPVDEANYMYNVHIAHIERVIMIHYLAGSKYNTAFWDYAKERAERCFTNSKHDEAFCDMVKYADNHGDFGEYPQHIFYSGKATQEFLNLNNIWWSGSFAQNLDGLGIRDRLEDVLGINSALEEVA